MRNMSIKELYGNYNFWSWFKYMYLDGVNLKAIMMADKSRVVYHKDKSWRLSIVQESGLTNREEMKKSNIGIGSYLKQKAKLLKSKEQQVIDKLRKD